MEALQTVLDEMGAKNLRRVTEAPKMADLTGFGQFLQNLRNQVMHPYLMGDFPADNAPVIDRTTRRRTYLVR